MVRILKHNVLLFVVFFILLMAPVPVNALSRIIQCDSVSYGCSPEHSTLPLPQDADEYKKECEVVCNNYCGLDGLWHSVNDTSNLGGYSLGENEEVNTLKYDLKQNYQCCPRLWCYNGVSCVPNQKDKPGDDNLYYMGNKAYRCVDGSWYEARSVMEWDNKAYGYCPRQSDCLVNRNGFSSSNYNPNAYFSYQQPQCIATGQYILDHYCYNGTWYTRTAIVAANIMQIAGTQRNDFKLVCDTPLESLNDVSYIVGTKIAKSFLERNCVINNFRVPCVNNFCVYASGDTRMFGVALNQPLFSDRYSFAELLGIDSCSELSNTEWLSCGSNVLYNEEKNILIYSNKPTLLSQVNRGTGFIEAFLQFIRHPIATILNLLRTGRITFRSKVGLLLGLKNLVPPDFDRLFLANSQRNSVVAFTVVNKYNPEIHRYETYMSVRFKNLDYNICAPINNLTGAYTHCNTTGNNEYYVFDRKFSASDLVLSWKDFTTKIEPR